MNDAGNPFAYLTDGPPAHLPSCLLARPRHIPPRTQHPMHVRAGAAAVALVATAKDAAALQAGGPRAALALLGGLRSSSGRTIGPERAANAIQVLYGSV